MRNIWCPRYDECLTRAALVDSDGFSCDGCPRSGDTGGRFKDPEVVREESLKCARLLFKVFPRLEGRFALGA